MELFSHPAAWRERERSHSTSVPDTGLLTTGVTMDMCSGLQTHAQALPVRWMTINHLIYERNSLSVACFLTCNNVTTPQQLRKMPGKGVEGCSWAKSRCVARLRCLKLNSAVTASVCGSEMYPITASFIYLMHLGLRHKAL